MDKSLILNEIKQHLNFKKDVDFAEFIGINQSTLSNWHKRGTIDYERIIAKCEDIDGNWLLTGKGEMLKNSREKKEVQSNEVVLLQKIIDLQEKEIDRLEKQNIKLKKTKEIKNDNMYVAEPNAKLNIEPRKK